MWRWKLAVCAMLLRVMTGSVGEAAVLLGFVDSGARLAVTHATVGAVRRFAGPTCQLLLTDFADGSGRALATTVTSAEWDPAAYFAALRFIDDSGAPQCRNGATLAFTSPGAHVIHVCGPRFRDRFLRDPAAAEIIVIHELLHVLGLGENPPASEAITAQVWARCGVH